MNDMKKNIRRVFWLYFALFLTVVIYLGKFILLDSQSVINSTYNPRLNRDDSTIRRGSIYDFEGNIIVESVLSDGSYKRIYAGTTEYAHTAGFIHSTKSGVEAKYNFNLNKLSIEIFQRARNLINNTPLQGDNIRLTINSLLQKEATDNLTGIKGGIAVIEPKTGRILALVSSPSFNPNEIGQIWDDLRADDKNSPLLNRATQGLYPPGSIFKTLSAEAIMSNMENYETYYYECKGEAFFDGDRIQCFDGKAHGTVDLHDAIKYSCNTYFAQAITEIGYDKLEEVVGKAYFNKAYLFDLERVASRFAGVSEASGSEIIQTAIGQGKTLVTPLHMAMVTSAIANGGVMMSPYICEEITSYSGSVKSTAQIKSLGQVFSPEHSSVLTEMMVSVVEGGTGTPSKVQGISIAGKTGTAQNASGEDHGWFIAFAPADEPEIAFAIVTENTGGSKKALEIGKKLIEVYFKE